MDQKKQPRQPQLLAGHGGEVAALTVGADGQRQSAARSPTRSLIRHHSYGAGWTDPERQQPVGDTGRHEPRHPDAILDAELVRALKDPDPLRGITQLTARLGAAFMLDPAGVTRTKPLGSERMARKLRDALPGGDGAVRAGVWELGGDHGILLRVDHENSPGR